MDAPTGTIVAYATAPESVADDGAGKNGMYTKHLLQAMTVPGLGIEQVFKAVRNNVINESNSKQIPWESTSLRGDFYFSSPRKEFSCSVECAPQDKPIDMVMASSQKNLIQYNKFKKNTGRSNPEFFTALKNIICDFRSIETSLKEHYNATRDESARNMQANTARTRQKYEDELCEKLPR
jgi:hypothetical protein